MRRPRALRFQRGAALLMAMLTVGLVAGLAATAYWQQWRAWAVERAERDRAQAGWLLTGALDWARLIVREDGRASSVDHLAEPWALALQPTRLAAFLERPSDGGDEANDAWLAGRIEDEQGRLNWRNLIEVVGAQPRVVTAERARFERLFVQLGLPARELEAVIQGLLQAWRAPDDAMARPLRPQRLADLQTLGLSVSTLRAIEPLTTWLPAATPLNANTAPAAVLQAAVPGLDAGAAQRLIEQRARQHFATTEAFLAALGRAGQSLDPTRWSVASRYFRVTGRVRVGDLEVEQRALLERDGTRVQIVWREQRPIPTVVNVE
jgi:general secretion pathway protein K